MELIEERIILWPKEVKQSRKKKLIRGIIRHPDKKGKRCLFACDFISDLT